MLRRLLQLGASQRVQQSAGACAPSSIHSLFTSACAPTVSPAAAASSAAAAAATRPAARVFAAGGRLAWQHQHQQQPAASLLLLRYASNNRASLKAAGLKAYKPTTPGFRGRIITSREGLWKGRPHKPLTQGLRKKAGRNRTGTITVRHRGGGHKRLYRLIDFKRQAAAGGVPAVVQRIEYDPNRTARIALVKYQVADDAEGAAIDGFTATLKDEYRYVLAPRGVAAGDVLHTGPSSPIRPGNTLPLASIPIGMEIHNVELYPGRGGQMARAAGTAAVLVGKGADGYATVKLPSGEQRMVPARCTATIGALSNAQHKNVKIGKAGAKRWKGVRPTVRGVAMNPVDHPHGGGRGKSKGRISQSPWGKPAKGGRTRNNPRTDPFIRISRHEAKRKSG